MCTALAIKIQKMVWHEQLSLLLLVPANILYSVAVWTHCWFELPGVAWYGLWWAYFCDFLGDCHIVPAFFTNEPGFYHLLQLLCLFAWGGLALSMYMLIFTNMDYKLPRFLRKSRNTAIAIICFASVFSMSGGLYLFYYIIDEFPRDIGRTPEIQWAAVFASFACLFQFVAGLLLLQVGH